MSSFISFININQISLVKKTEASITWILNGGNRLGSFCVPPTEHEAGYLEPYK
jgi:hypothetical protein